MRLLVLILGLALAGCRAPVRATNFPVDDGSEGRKVYVAKCAKCHKFYDPSKYSDDEWNKWMGKMSKKAKLKPEQEQALARYVNSALRAPRKIEPQKQQPAP